MRVRAAALAWVPVDAYLAAYRRHFPSVGAAFYDQGLQIRVRYPYSMIERLERSVAAALAVVILAGVVVWLVPVARAIDFGIACPINDSSDGDAATLQAALDAKIAEAEALLADLNAEAQQVAADGGDSALLAQADAKLNTGTPNATSQLSAAATAADASRDHVNKGNSFYTNGRYNDSCAALQSAITLLNEAQALIDQARPPLITIVSTAQVNEGDAGTSNVILAVSLSQPTTVAMSVDYATSGGTATAGVDYAATSGTLNFAAGATSGNISVPINGDTTVELDETFLVRISNPSRGSITSSQSTVTITNDDAVVPVISIQAAAAADEGNSGTSTVDLTVTLSEATTVPVSVAYASANGTATVANGDYEAASASLSFAPGETSKTISVTVKGDTQVEAEENFTVTLSNPNGATLGTSVGTVTIRNDDFPKITVNDVSHSEGDTGTTTFAVLTVSLSVPATNPVSVNYETEDGTATI
ncbi:MAG: Calx-beta domain-containing protein, partial [Actinomycetota bacterium]